LAAKVPICRIVSLLASGALAAFPAPICAQTSSAGRFEDDLSRDRAIGCLATAIAYEAGYEPRDGQQAVAEVILNRTRNTLFPNTVCGVVFQGSERTTGCQFSFTCDGSLRRRMPDMVMTNAKQLAAAALDGLGTQLVSGATHYHADYVSPYWAPSLIRVTKIGRHIFYRYPDGRAPAYRSGITPGGIEPSIPRLQDWASRHDSVAKPSDNLAPIAPKPFAPWGLPITQPSAGH